ncbi:hypothetical protein L3Q82_000918 [Scortum barcoo]|uniref:Uncharacterized protein n=1 Tax=Scortum barcoo TaxID=214431 RepID=A0ACB8WAZ9_9TELE|nr:hypothetical protein L3Q82_000918 [Scortum barcoo]
MAGAEELYGYGHTKIGMVGTCTFSVRYGSRFLLVFHGVGDASIQQLLQLGYDIVRGTPWGRGKRWPVSGHVNGGICTCTGITSRCGQTAVALTALLATTGSDHKPLCLYRWSERLQAYNFTTQFTPGRENVVADLLSRAMLCSALDTVQDPQEPELILMLHTPPQGAISLQELEAASARDPVLTQLRAFIRGGWPTKVSEESKPIVSGMTFLAGTMSVWRGGFATVVPSALRARVLTMVHEGHLGVVKVRQRCRGLVWWPGIDRDMESMTRDCTACLSRDKTGPPPPPPLQPLLWPSALRTQVQVDICNELHSVPQHQRFLLVAYDLHSKWPKVLPTGSVTTRVVTDFLSSLFAC